MTVPVTEQDIERMGREVRHSLNTRWPEGDSWIRGYAEDVGALLEDRASIQASLVSAQEALRRISSDEFTAHNIHALKELARAGLAGTAERQEARQGWGGVRCEACGATASAGDGPITLRHADNCVEVWSAEPPAKPEEETT